MLDTKFASRDFTCANSAVNVKTHLTVLQGAQSTLRATLLHCVLMSMALSSALVYPTISPA